MAATHLYALWWYHYLPPSIALHREAQRGIGFSVKLCSNMKNAHIGKDSQWVSVREGKRAKSRHRLTPVFIDRPKPRSSVPRSQKLTPLLVWLCLWIRGPDLQSAVAGYSCLLPVLVFIWWSCLRVHQLVVCWCGVWLTLAPRRIFSWR